MRMNVRHVAALCLLAIPAARPSQASDKDDALVRQATAQIVASRVTVRSYVFDVKSKFKDDTVEYAHARKLYVTAQARFSGWAAYLKAAIRDGDVRQLQADDAYAKWSGDAGIALEQFVTYVESKTQSSEAVLPIVSGLADLGLKIWNGIKDRAAKDRAARADAFEKDTKWDDWDGVK